MRRHPSWPLLALALGSRALAADGPSLEHPMAPSSLALRGGGTRRVLFQARWHGKTAPTNPMTEGGTLRVIGGPGQGDSGSWRSRPTAGDRTGERSGTPTRRADRRASAPS